LGAARVITDPDWQFVNVQRPVIFIEGSID
jgi:hypothetical protein